MTNILSRRHLVAGAAAASLLAGAAQAADFRAVLNGDNLSPPGDTDGWGRIAFHLDQTLNRLCADVEVRGIGAVTEVKIYRGHPGDIHDPVVDLQAPDDNDSNDCDSIGDTLADEIQASPASFHVLVKTAEYPQGAIRGALAPS